MHTNPFRLLRPVAVITLLAFLLAGCADTKLEKTWTAPEVGSLKFSKVFILGLVKDDMVRRLAEIAIRNDITRVPTVTSFSVLPEISDLADKAKVIEAIKASGADGLIVMRSLYRDTEVEYTGNTALPMQYQIFSDYYGTYYDVGAYYAADRRQVSADNIFGIETNIYDARTDKLVWSGQTRSTKNLVKGHDVNALISDVVNTLRAALKSQKLVD
jgi:hypothetical protein